MNRIVVLNKLRTTVGFIYVLYSPSNEHVVYNDRGKVGEWKTPQGAYNFALKHGYVVKDPEHLLQTKKKSKPRA